MSNGDFRVSRCTTEIKSRVSLSYSPDYELPNVTKAVHDVIDHLGGIRQFISSGDTVLIKPNLIKGCPPEQALTTHPAVVEAVACQVLNAGGKPFIGDSPAFGELSSVAGITGMEDICRRHNIPLVPFNKPVRVAIRNEWIKSISIDRSALEADKIINIPKLKTHCQVGMSGAIKNLFGCVVGKRKPLLHFRAGDYNHRFGVMLFAIYNILNPALNIVDGVMGMEGQGPTSGTPKYLGLIAASTDGPALDRILCEIIGTSASSVEVLEALREHYNIQPDLNKMVLSGTPLSKFAGKTFTLPVRQEIRFNLPRTALSVLKQIGLRLRSKGFGFHRS
ncbi:MAG: DUF362 domain-containing protein [Nitrospirae bacterium]|nr:DUF362 domain-containing protein [Nitrospirota bacterium]